MQIFKGVASGKQSFREHCATKWLLEANPRNISASKISRYTVYLSLTGKNRLVYMHVSIVTRLVYCIYCYLVSLLCFVAYRYTRTSRKRRKLILPLDFVTCGGECTCALHPQPQE